MALSFIRANWLAITAGLLLSPVFVVLLPFAIDAGVSIQERMVPIITNWKVESVSTEDKDLVLSGVMTKHRDCFFMPPTLARDQTGLNHRVISRANTGGLTWAADDKPQKWGPWIVPDGIGKKFTFINVYLCGSRPSVVELGSFP